MDSFDFDNIYNQVLEIEYFKNLKYLELWKIQDYIVNFIDNRRINPITGKKINFGSVPFNNLCLLCNVVRDDIILHFKNKFNFNFNDIQIYIKNLNSFIHILLVYLFRNSISVQYFYDTEKNFNKDKINYYIEKFEKDKTVNPISGNLWFNPSKNRNKIPKDNIALQYFNQLVLETKQIKPERKTELHYDHIEEIINSLNYENNKIFPSSYSLNSTWRQAWLNKLNKSVSVKEEYGYKIQNKIKFEIKEIYITIKKNHYLTVDHFSKLDNEDTLLRFIINCNNLKNDAYSLKDNKLIFKKDTVLSANFMSNKVILDNSIRLLPALKIKI